ncbi:MAG TPA: putative DNA modification/repair radical SAM protein [Cytophagales bacterium]|nr:putative DNA modification/repair radical SAM protein [Cytophagales bacterium]
MDRLQEKIEILSAAAKYDVSCSSSGSNRRNKDKGLGNAEGMGICHSYTEDGRCVSLLKILLTNHCIYDCAYCVSKKSNDIKRAAFTVEEVIDLTINFYRRNYIEGLFLSSGIFKNSDYTMERLVRVAKELRLKHNFNGYIHLKAIPGASDELLREAGLYADRLSVNIELPTEESLKSIAPEKSFGEILTPMNFIKNQSQEYQEDKARLKKVPKFVPAGQSTQLIVGASPENDMQILTLANELYHNQQLKRVYYSGYIPVLKDMRLPTLLQPPKVRENRIYQADWLMRFYGFDVAEIVSNKFPNLDLDIDPKLSYALRNPEMFPVDVNLAPYEMVLRIPGVGLKSAKMIIASRKFGKLHFDHLSKMGVVMKRAKYFLTCPGNEFLKKELFGTKLKNLIISTELKNKSQQLNLFSAE